MKKTIISKFRDLSIKVKLLAAIYLIMAVGTSIFAISALIGLREIAFEQFKYTAKSTTVLLSKNLSLGFDINNAFSLTRIMDAYKESDENIKSLSVINRSYLVTGSIDDSLVGQNVKTESIVIAIQKGITIERSTIYKSEPVIEIITPIFTGSNKTIGVVRILYSLKRVDGLIYKEALELFVVILILSVPLILSAIFIVNSAIIGPIRKVIQTANQIVVGKDLAQVIKVKNNDEIGELGLAFNKMISDLREMIGRVKDVARVLNVSSSQILASAKQQASGATEQAASVGQTAATIEELAIASRRISEDSSNVVQVAEKTLGSAQESQNIAKNTTEGVFKIREETELNAQKILTLGRKSQQIGSVLEIIKDVADQTNMLALNAAIEAARAGESGKGFGVVATEIRKLAEHVVDSAKQIEEIIEEIQATTNVAVISTEKSMKNAESGVELTQKTKEELQKILDMIEETTESAERISITIRQQQSANDQVADAMKEISNVAQQNAAASSQAISSAKELNRLSEDLQSMVNRYNV